jgi:signal transduction histidine kinase
VLVNLVDNAIKYTQSGGIALKVGLYDGRVRFLVEDTGIGMRPEHLGEIFDVFHQVHDPSYAVQGTGLGLAIAKRLVRLMGGDLRVESEPNQGSRFWFDLDLPEVATAPRAVGERCGGAGNPAASAGGGGRSAPPRPVPRLAVTARLRAL